MVQKILSSSSSGSNTSSAIATMGVMYILLVFILCLHGNNGSYYYKGAAAAVSVAPRNNDKNNTVAAILVFGDSIVDPGNNNHRQSVAKCDFPPYGQDFMGGKPTGRFSNGLIPPDLIAQWFGVKELVPAYLDPNLQIEDLITGVSFASGGAGFDPLTSNTETALSLSDQLDMFKGYLGRLRAVVGEQRTTAILSQSIFIICAGSNDIATTYFTFPIRKKEYDLSSYTDFLVTSASSLIQELYELGARKIGVLGVAPLGCLPSERTLAGGIERRCAEPRNEAALLFNSKLTSQLEALSAQLPWAKLVYLDAYSPVLALIKNPAQHGFEEVSRGCCGTGIIEVALLCNRFTPNTCTDASKYVFWDSFHPTQATYSILVHEIFTEQASKFF